MSQEELIKEKPPRRYVSIDIETTGLNEDKCQILEFGAIIEDMDDIKPKEELKKFRRIIIHKEIHGEPFALTMDANVELLKAIRDHKKLELESNENLDAQFCHPEELAEEFKLWLLRHGFKTNDTIKYEKSIEGLAPEDIGECRPCTTSGKVLILVAGKNYKGFDDKFLKLEPYALGRHVYCHQRVIDPAVSLMDWTTDVVPPDLKECKKRVGIIDDEVRHTAIDDSMDIIRVVRKMSNNYKNKFTMENE